MDRLHVATLNIRNLADRWPERQPLLVAGVAALQPDLLALQEVVFSVDQDRLLATAGEARYGVTRGWAGRPEYGNSLLVREPLVARDADRIDLGLDRSALRAVLAFEGGATVLVVVTHLHHAVGASAKRDEQARGLLAWLSSAPIAEAHVVMGDFNASPDEAAADRMRAHGYRSAYAEANGSDPAITWPSGIQAPGMDTDGDPACLDYVWVRGAVRVTSASLEFDRPHADDPTLYPSDHFGLSAHLEFGLPERWEDR
jgi:endonuclease/exonuclease/phosphatase family metal-dependent hydrolase